MGAHVSHIHHTCASIQFFNLVVHPTQTSWRAVYGGRGRDLCAIPLLCDGYWRERPQRYYFCSCKCVRREVVAKLVCFQPGETKCFFSSYYYIGWRDDILVDKLD